LEFNYLWKRKAILENYRCFVIDQTNAEMAVKMVLPVFFFLFTLRQILALELDPNGYVMYCPCMGRFGNQADHFLGALSFAKGLNRTLVLPPWVEYRKGQSRSVQVPFDAYFNVKAFEVFHRVVTMEDFFGHIGETVWPIDKRISFCYADRPVIDGKNVGGVCNAKNGNPFGPFWDNFDVEFVGSETYGPLHYDVHYTSVAQDWKNKYPSTKWPVLAFTGAPAPYPVQKDNVILQKYLKWNPNMIAKAEDFIRKLPKGPFIGVHMRNGIDWSRACEHVVNAPTLFASAQCLGYTNEHGKASTELCLPSEEIIIRQLRRTISQYKAKSIFVASDSNHMIEKLNKVFKKISVTAHKLPEDNPHLDLAILGRANHFIGNCVSSFSAFVKRERDVNGFPSSFWAFPTYVKPSHNEL